MTKRFLSIAPGLLLTVWLCSLSMQARAQVYVDATATGTASGASWDDATTLIQTGIDLAATSGIAEVWVARGVYIESIALTSGVLVLGGFAGTETDVGDRDFVANVTVIDATAPTTGTRRAALMDSTTTAGLDGLTLTGGLANGSSGIGDVDGWGGGMLVMNAGPSNTIANCVFDGNTAMKGGGLYCAGSSPTLYSCLFSSNSAEYGAGMALVDSSFIMENCFYLNNQATTGGAGLYLERSDPEFKDCVIADNQTTGMGGGLMALNSQPDFQDSFIQNNSALRQGGGLYFVQSGGIIYQCVITANAALNLPTSGLGFGGGGYFDGAAPQFTGTEIGLNSAVNGGGLYCVNATTLALSLSHCRLTTNTTSVNGGAIYGENTALAISDCDMKGNTAGANAGGMFLRDSIASVTTCSIGANTASEGGGGFYLEQTDMQLTASAFISNSAQVGGALSCVLSSPTLSNCAITSNIATSFGGALFSLFSWPRLTDTTLNANSAEMGGAIFFQQSITTLTRCLMQGNTSLSTGGAVYATNCIPSLHDCQILNNFAAFNGGGIGYLRSDGEMRRCRIENNASGEKGGGLALDHAAPLIAETDILGNSAGLDGGGAWLTGSRPTIQDSSIQGNDAGRDGAGIYGEFADFIFSGGVLSGNAAQRDGGGVWLSRSRAVLTGCEISNNAATSNGAGLACDLSAPTVDTSLINGNVAGGAGGGVFCTLSSPLFVASRLSGNYSGGDGGAVASVIDSDPTFDRCLLDANEANGLGGAWYSYDFSFGDAVNTIFYRNHAAFNGGAIYSGLNGSVSAVNCVIHANTASGWGGGVYCEQGSDPFCTNTILTQNTKFAMYEGSADARVISGYCLFDGNPDGDFFDFVSGPLTGAVAINLNAPGSQKNIQGDPLFVNPAALDFHIQDGSSALKRGFLANAPLIDLDGDLRPGTDGKVDIGVDEEDAFNPPPDVLPPVSRVYGLLPVTTTYQFNVPYEATDDESGVQYVQIFFRKDGGPWMAYGFVYYASPVAFDASFFGDGLYEFYSIATDNAGNVEVKTGPDDQTIVITTFISVSGIIYVAPDGPGIGDSWAQALGSLRSAIGLAELSFRQTGVMPEIWVSEGTYREVISVVSGTRLMGGFPFGAAHKFQSDGAAHPTILNAMGAAHAVSMISVTSALIDGFTITGGLASGIGPEQTGAGIYCYHADASNSITRCLITGNVATDFGAGVLCDNFSSPRFDRCHIEGNLSSSGSGAGIACRAFSNPYLTRCSISNNIGYFGGAVYSEFSSPRFENCILAHNSAWRGAALYGYYYNDPPFAFCTISDNLASSLGGGFFLLGESNPLIQASTFTNNSNVAIYEADSGSDPFTSHCLFWNNPDGHYFDHALLAGGTLYTRVSDFNTVLPESYLNKEGDPAYMNAAAGDYRLTSASACIDDISTSELISVSDSGGDYARQPRPVNVLFDIGAYEFSRISILGAPLVFPDTFVGTPSPFQTLTVSNSSALTESVTLQFGGTAAADFRMLGAASFALPPSSARLIQVNFQPTRQGERDAFLIASSPNGGASGDLFGYGIGQLAGVTTSALDFGILYAKDAPSSPMATAITNTGYDTLVIDSIIFLGADAADFRFETTFTLPLSIAAGSSAPLSLVFDPRTPGTKVAMLRIHTDDITHPYLTVGLTGLATLQILRVAPPDALFFGQVPFDLPTSPVLSTLPLVLYNDGNIDLNFTTAGLVLGGPDAAWFQFSVAPSTDTAIAGGASRTVDVTFTSSEPLGVKTAWLVITVDDPDHATTTITLNGEVVSQATIPGSVVREWIKY